MSLSEREKRIFSKVSTSMVFSDIIDELGGDKEDLIIDLCKSVSNVVADEIDNIEDEYDEEIIRIKSRLVMLENFVPEITEKINSLDSAVGELED